MSTYIDLISKLSDQDKFLITKYVNKNGCWEDYFIGVDKWLQNWSHANQKLYHLLGDKFIYEFDYKYEKTSEILDKELYNLITESDFIENYSVFLAEVIEKKYYFRNAESPLTSEQFRFLTSLINKNTFLNDKVESTFKFKKDGARKVLQIQAGAKPLRALNQVMNYFEDEYHFDRNAFEDFRKKHAIVLSEKIIKGIIGISIHPLDYMTMSDNSFNWTSCMSWKDHGCYHVGTVEMMNSNNVLCCYIKDNHSKYHFDTDKETGEVYFWNNKKWRQLFYITKDILMGGKPYPYSNTALTQRILYEIKKLAEQNLNWTYDFGPELYKDMIHIHGSYRMDKQRQWMKAKSYTKHNILWDTKGMYNDMLNDIDTQYWCFRNKVEHTKIISVSGKTSCLCCGNKTIYYEETNDYNERYYNVGSTICRDCEENIFKCDYCFQSNRFRKTHTLPNGKKICQTCIEEHLFYCPNCGKISYIENTIPNIIYNPSLYNYITNYYKDSKVLDFALMTINPMYSQYSEKELDKRMQNSISPNLEDEIWVEKLYCCDSCIPKVNPDVTFYKKGYWSRDTKYGLLLPQRAQKYRYNNLKKASLEDLIEQINKMMNSSNNPVT